MIALALITLSLLASPLSITYAASAPSPWPISTHDSSLSNAATPGVPAYTSFDATPITMPPQGGIANAFIPAAGIYVFSPASDPSANLTMYNRSSKMVQTITSPAFQVSLTVAGVDPSSGLRLYYSACDTYGGCGNSSTTTPNGAFSSFGAISLSSGEVLWSMTHPSLSMRSLVLDTFTDSLDLISLVENETFAMTRYSGSTGTLLWGIGIIEMDDVAVVCTIPANGARILAMNSKKHAWPTLLALDGATGDQLWTYPAKLITSVAAYGNTLVNALMPSHSTFSVLALEGDTGTVLWNVSYNATLPSCTGLSFLTMIPRAAPNFAIVGLLVCQKGKSQKLVALDGLSGALLNSLSVPGNQVYSVVSAGTTVYYVNGKSIASWDIVSGKTATLYESSAEPMFIVVDADGSLVVPLNGDAAPGAIVLLTPAGV